MTEAEMKAQLQIGQDMLDQAILQRNANANECLRLVAELKLALRKVAEHEAKLSELSAQAEPTAVAPHSNGHAEVAQLQ